MTSQLLSLRPGLVAVPCTEVMWTRSVAAIAAATRAFPPQVDVVYDWCQVPTVQKRNYLVERFVSDMKYQWLLFVDSDMLPDPDGLIRLAEEAEELKLDVLAAHCFTRHHVPFQACGGWRSEKNELSWIEADKWDGGIHEVDWVGTGCVYLSRVILERMTELRGREVFRPAAGMEKYARGEDQEFCASAKIAEFRLFYHTGIAVGHLGLTNIEEGFVRRIDQRVPDRKPNCTTFAKSL